MAEERKAQGFYQRFSQAGLAKLRAMQAESGGVRPGHAKRSEVIRAHNYAVPRKHSSGWHKTKKAEKKSMDIIATIEQIIAAAQLKPVEERVVVLGFGLRGEEAKRLNELVELCKADESVKAKVTHEWVRHRQAKAIQRMRGAMGTLHIDTAVFRQACKDEPYKSLCNVLIGSIE